MAITRMQIPEQIRGYQDGGLASIDAFMPISTTEDSTVSQDNIDELRSNPSLQMLNFLRPKPFEETRRKYQDRLGGLYQEPKALDFYDLATDLSKSIMAAPPSQGPFRSLASGFNTFSDRMKAQENETKKYRQKIALEATKLAMDDERKAEDRLRDFVAEMYEQQSIGDVDVVTLQYEEFDLEGNPTGRQITRSFDKKTQAKEILGILRNQSGVKVSDLPQPTGETTLDKEAAKNVLANKTEYDKQGSTNYGKLDAIQRAKIIAEDLGEGGYGRLESISLPFRQIIAGIAPWAVDLEKLKGQEALESLSIIFTLANVAQTKGAISNREMELFQRAAPSLGQTYQGFMLALDIQERAARKSIEFNQEYNAELSRLMRENPNILGAQLNSKMADWETQWRKDGRDSFITDEQKQKIAEYDAKAREKGIASNYSTYEEKKLKFYRDRDRRNQVDVDQKLMDQFTSLSPEQLKIVQEALADETLSQKDKKTLIEEALQ